MQKLSKFLEHNGFENESLKENYLLINFSNGYQAQIFEDFRLIVYFGFLEIQTLFVDNKEELLMKLQIIESLRID